MEARRLILALFAAFAVYIAYQQIYRWLRPAKPPVTAPVHAIPGLPDAPAPAHAPDAVGASAPASAPASVAPVTTLSLHGQDGEERVTLGSAGDSLRVELTTRGAAVAKLWLVERDKSGRFVHRMGPKSDEPYQMLDTLSFDGVTNYSFPTTRLWIVDRSERAYDLAELDWNLVTRPVGGDGAAVFAATLATPDDAAPVLRLTKSYRLGTAPQTLAVELAFENLDRRPLRVAVEQAGALGIHLDNRTHEVGHILWGRRTADGVKVDYTQRPQLARLTEPRKLGSGQDAEKLLWTAISNKYFTVVTRPLPAAQASSGEAVQAAFASVLWPARSERLADVQTRYTIAPAVLPPHVDEPVRVAFEVYAGPKDPEILARSNPAFVDETALGYHEIQAADVGSCACTFQPLPAVMTWLLDTIHFFVRNYGVAIVGLVLIVRGLLHPLAVFQQKSMYRMQEATVRIQPRIEALKERYPNDKVKFQQEMMKVWAEENVNPAAGMVAMVPLFIQMPILVALWVSLNSDIHLRNAPFDGWWITDLSAPDALFTFSERGVHIPILSWIMGPIYSLNLLPILMGISMLLQQKYMPKPSHMARQEAAAQRPESAKPKSGMTPEEQLRQQQMIGYMMCALFPLMFYHFPSGLTLYWFATNIFGIVESLIIRKQIAEEKARRAREGPVVAKPRKPGIVQRWMKTMAEQAEELQRKADEVTDVKKKR
ncbi:MAG: membrane protein insertase YidC [Phycisphaerae bacterium]